MGKKKASSHRERVEKLNKHRTDKAIDVAYEMGHRNGFYNCLTIMLYAVMESTNYKHNGLMKIWNKTLDITEALLMPETGLKPEDIMLALADEAGIVVDEAHVKKARKIALEKGTNNQDYRKVVEDAVKLYKALLDARLEEERANEHETES